MNREPMNDSATALHRIFAQGARARRDADVHLQHRHFAGLKAAWSGAGGQFPDAVRLGFNRKEYAWAPLSMTTNAATTNAEHDPENKSRTRSNQSYHGLKTLLERHHINQPDIDVPTFNRANEAVHVITGNTNVPDIFLNLLEVDIEHLLGKTAALFQAEYARSPNLINQHTDRCDEIVKNPSSE